MCHMLIIIVSYFMLINNSQNFYQFQKNRPAEEISAGQVSYLTFCFRALVKDEQRSRLKVQIRLGRCLYPVVLCLEDNVVPCISGA